MNKKDQRLSNVAADLVSSGQNPPFIIQLLCLKAGEWLNVFDACSHWPEMQKRLQEIRGKSEENLYATWLKYPELDFAEGEDEFCVIVFFVDIEHWSTNAIFNKTYFFDRHGQM